MGLKEFPCEVVAVGTTTPISKGEGVMIQLYNWWYPGFIEWFLIPEAHKTEMLTIAIEAINHANRVLIGIEEPGYRKEPEPYTEIKSIYLLNGNTRIDDPKDIPK